MEDLFEELSLLIRRGYDKRLDQPTRLLALRVAEEYGRFGRERAIGFLRGYWYVKGTSRYDAITYVASIFDLVVSEGDLS